MDGRTDIAANDAVSSRLKIESILEKEYNWKKNEKKD